MRSYETRPARYQYSLFHFSPNHIDCFANNIFNGTRFSKGDKIYEQNEIEFLPANIEDAADQLIIAKWILRTLAYQYGVTVTFAPKITVGKAGSGLHIHTKIVKDGETAMISDGTLSDTAKKAIAGYLDLAPSLTAFGNINPTNRKDA